MVDILNSTVQKLSKSVQTLARNGKGICLTIISGSAFNKINMSAGYFQILVAVLDMAYHCGSPVYGGGTAPSGCSHVYIPTCS